MPRKWMMFTRSLTKDHCSQIRILMSGCGLLRLNLTYHISAKRHVIEITTMPRSSRASGHC
jgi:hypothetical protein